MSLHLAALCLALVADEPMSAEKTATISRETEKASAEVDAKFGNKKFTELTPQERADSAKEKAAAEKKVLDKNGVDAKTWARESLRKNRDEYSQQKQLKQQLIEQEKAADAAKKAGGPSEISVQRGFNEENPVILEEKENEDGKITVEKGLPPDVGQDQAAAEGDGMTAAERGAAPADDGAKAAPAKGGSKGGGKNR